MSDEACDLPPNEPQPEGASPAAGLVLVSTPIGNLGDMTFRARLALQAAHVVLCEDTRRTGRLLAACGLAARLETLNEQTEDLRIPHVLALLRQGRVVALVSDAGTPLVSDPGFRLVRAAIEEGLPVTAVPGPNAAVTALVLSGLPPLPFLSLGFPPPRQAARRAAFGQLRAAEQAGLSATLVWHEAPHRLAESLADMAEAFPGRPAAVARELTKRFEEVRRGPIEMLAAHYSAEPARGEITVVVGPHAAGAPDAEDLDTRLLAALQAHSVRDAAALVTAATGLPRKLIYARALALSSRT